MALYWRGNEHDDLSLKHMGGGYFYGQLLKGKCLYIYKLSPSCCLISKALEKIFPSHFFSPSHYHTTNHLRRNISLFKTEGQADEVGDLSEKAVN